MRKATHTLEATYAYEVRLASKVNHNGDFDEILSCMVDIIWVLIDPLNFKVN